MRVTIKQVRCPTCDSPEEHPTDSNLILIRAYKVADARGRWWSQCLVCAGGYDANLEPITDFDTNKGWFA